MSDTGSEQSTRNYYAETAELMTKSWSNIWCKQKTIQFHSFWEMILQYMLTNDCHLDSTLNSWSQESQSRNWIPYTRESFLSNHPPTTLSSTSMGSTKVMSENQNNSKPIKRQMKKSWIIGASTVNFWIATCRTLGNTKNEKYIGYLNTYHTSYYSPPIFKICKIRRFFTPT